MGKADTIYFTERQDWRKWLEKNFETKNFIFTEYIIKRLKTEECVWKNYQNFSESYKRIRIAYIEAARKRPDEFNKRLKNFINKTKENRLIKGFGGIDKYY